MLEALTEQSAAIQTILSALSLATVVLTIVLVVRQNREMARQGIYAAYATAMSVYQQTNVLMMEIDRFFFENPEFRPYFYGDAVPGDGVEEAQLDAISEMLIDFLDMVIVLSAATPSELQDSLVWDGWLAYIVDLCRTSSSLSRWYQENRDWYSSEVRELLDEATSSTHI